MYPARTDFLSVYLVDSAGRPGRGEERDRAPHLAPPAKVDDVAGRAAVPGAGSRFIGRMVAEILDERGRGLIGGAVGMDMVQERFPVWLGLIAALYAQTGFNLAHPHG
jgi:hypothetical protein